MLLWREYYCNTVMRKPPDYKEYYSNKSYGSYSTRSCIGTGTFYFLNTVHRTHYYSNMRIMDMPMDRGDVVIGVGQVVWSIWNVYSEPVTQLRLG